MLNSALEPDLLLNINIPDLPYEQLGSLQVTRLGHRHKSEPAMKMNDPRGRTVYWVGPVGSGEDAGPGTDFYAIQHGNISVTPLQFDLTRHGVLDDLSQWVTGIKLDE